jgi:hypothetical protein
MKGVRGWKMAAVKWWLKWASMKRGKSPEIMERNLGFLMTVSFSAYSV